MKKTTNIRKMTKLQESGKIADKQYWRNENENNEEKQEHYCKAPRKAHLIIIEKGRTARNDKFIYGMCSIGVNGY